MGTLSSVVDRSKSSSYDRGVYFYILEELVHTVNLKHAVLSYCEGQTIASLQQDNADANRLSAIGGFVSGLGEKAIGETIKGELEMVSIRCDNCLILVMSITDQVNLTVVADEGINMGFLLAELRRAMEQLREHMVEEVLLLHDEIKPSGADGTEQTGFANVA